MDRRRLLKEDDLEEALDAFRQTVNKIHSGPDRLMSCLRCPSTMVRSPISMVRF